MFLALFEINYFYAVTHIFFLKKKYKDDCVKWTHAGIFKRYLKLLNDVSDKYIF